MTLSFSVKLYNFITSVKSTHQIDRSGRGRLCPQYHLMLGDRHVYCQGIRGGVLLSNTSGGWVGKMPSVKCEVLHKLYQCQDPRRLAMKVSTLIKFD